MSGEKLLERALIIRYRSGILKAIMFLVAHGINHDFAVVALVGANKAGQYCNRKRFSVYFD